MNAVITSAHVGYGGYQDQLLSLYVWVTTEDGGSFMAEGGIALYLPEDWKAHKKISLLGHIIDKWLQAADCQDVSQLKGRPVRIDFETDHQSHVVINRVGHIVDNKKWFSTFEIAQQAKVSAE